MYGKLYLMYPGQKEFDLNVRLPSVRLLDLKSSAPAIVGNWLTVPGSDGQRLQSTTFGATTVTASVFIDAKNMADFRIVKRQLQSMLYNRTLIRLRSSFEPDKVYWVQANPSEITPIQASSQSLVDLVFTNPSGMAQSVIRSDQLPAQIDQMGFGLNVPTNDLNYHFNASTFNVENISDVTIDPYVQHHDLKITIKGIGASFTLKNETNGTSITVKGSMKSGDVFVINGVTSYLNGKNDVETDYGYIKLDKGTNQFKLSGLTNIDIVFSFPFLYF